MLKTRLFTLILIISALAICGEPALSAGGSSRFSVSAGYFQPFEGDFRAAATASIGYEYSIADQTLIANYTTSCMADDKLGFPSGTKHALFNLGLLIKYPPSNKLSIGGGIQNHHIDYGFDNIRFSRFTLYSQVRYSLGHNLALDAAISQRTSRKGLKFGGYTVALTNRF